MGWVEMANRTLRTGDDGFTDVLGEGRVSKSDLRIETLGSIDEATSSLGVARACCKNIETAELIERIQHSLYRIMSEIAATPQNTKKFRSVDAQEVQWLEDTIEYYSEKREPIHEFIIPGDTTFAAALDLARVFVRRAERRFVELLSSGSSANMEIMQYLNRLSTLCFELELDAIHSSEKIKPTLAKK